MGTYMLLNREIRRVPLDWQHPTNERGEFLPLFDDYAGAAKAWDEGEAAWDRAAWDRGEGPGDAWRDLTWVEWSGWRPSPEDYMPSFPTDADMGICMYETTTEGSPISAVYPDTVEGRVAMANELADGDHGITTGLSADAWLQIIEGGDAARDVSTGEVEIR